MQLVIQVVFLFATALCNINVSHVLPFNPESSTEQAKQEFVNGPEQNSTEINQGTSTVIQEDIRDAQRFEESINKVLMNENENFHEAAEPLIQPPIENNLENTITEEEIKKEKNEVPARSHTENQYDTKSNQTTNNEVTTETLLQEETLPTPAFNCSTMWPECTNPHNALEDVSRELTRFTLALYKTLSSLDEEPNIVIAPLSIALGLSQLMLGASGKTRDDMLQIIYGGMKDTKCVHDALWNLTKYNSFVSANEIFFSKDISLKEEFTRLSERFYGSKGTQLKREKNMSLKQINSWVSTKTNQLITKVFKQLPDFKMLLINVIYYQGKWINRFDPKLTKKESFQTTSSSTVQVPMMNNHKYPLQSIRDHYLQAHVARLPLSNNCSLIIFLPLSQERDALKIVETRLTEEIVNLLMTQLEEKSPRATSVSFPKLKLDSDFGLSEMLSLLGLNDLFQNPNFCALSDSPDLVISDIRHRAVLEIKEDGAKAAAATSITVARTMSLFSVQRPFLYIIANDINKTPFVIGRVGDPSK
ncbi:plasma protease C1 inhibitor [Hyla sarda]|uniref:plasma protease C1 inhibitor n=1 Tax=Hyla sarda TaxID=327740 RepID=UPI0024C2DF19|nr:plasma protease C1 inhibitor [Hyla sarda]